MFGPDWCGGMSVGGWLLMALLWGSFLAVIVWAITRLFPRGRSRTGELDAPGDGENADSALDRHLAAGDIDEDTYVRQRSDLTHAG